MISLVVLIAALFVIVVVSLITILLDAWHPDHAVCPKVGTYLADFRYFDAEKSAEIFEDVKGVDVPLQKWKRRHAEAQYGITVSLYPPRLSKRKAKR